MRRTIGEMRRSSRARTRPFLLTLDIVFPDRATYERFKALKALDRVTIAGLYGVMAEDVLKIIEFDPAYAVRSPCGGRWAGALGESDVYGAQQRPADGARRLLGGHMSPTPDRPRYDHPRSRRQAGLRHSRSLHGRGDEAESHAIAVDAGSTDPGPYYLGAGVPFTNGARSSAISPMILGRRGAAFPVLVGSAGAAGHAPSRVDARRLSRDLSGARLSLPPRSSARGGQGLAQAADRTRGALLASRSRLAAHRGGRGRERAYRGPDGLRAPCAPRHGGGGHHRRAGL
jgi:hypothetical protein